MNKFLKNSFFSVLSWIVPLVIMVITVPLFIKYLGNEQYGIYLLLTNIMSFINLLNFGTSDSVIKYVSELKDYDFKKLNDIMNSSISINIITSFIIMLIIIIFKGVILKSFLKVNSNDPYYCSLLIIVAVTFVINFMTNNFISLFKGVENFFVPTIINIVNSIILNLVSIFLLIKGAKLNEILLLNLLFAIISLAVYYIECKRIFPKYKFKLKFSKITFNKIFNFSKYAFLVSIFGLIIFNSDKLFIAYFFSTTMVTYYSVSANLAMKLQQFLSSAINAIFPKVSSMYANGKHNGIRYIYYKLIKFSTLFLVLILVPSTIYAYKLLNLWVGNSIAKNSYIALIILFFAYSFSGLMAIPYYFFYGLGMPKYNMYLSGIGAFLNIVLNIILIPKMNINGAAIATLVSNLYFLYGLIKVAKVIKLNLVSIIKLFKQILLILIPYVCICLILKHFIINIYMLIIIYIIDFLIFIFLYFRLRIADKDEVKYIKSFCNLK